MLAFSAASLLAHSGTGYRRSAWVQLPSSRAVSLISALDRQIVEHPFGTIKAWMGATQFQMRTLPKVAAEMALHVLAYNLSDANSRYWRIDGRHAGLRRILARPNQPRADDLRTSSDARGARFSKFCRADPPNPRRYRCARNRGANRARSHAAWVGSGHSLEPPECRQCADTVEKLYFRLRANICRAVGLRIQKRFGGGRS